ncbi:hypothetical protein D7Y41_30590 [Anaerotruncus sp. 1XD22-93]|nr:hypothetical protein D7Y41_30590 [Anaerotruncus sp. 1XD22-93]
MRISLSLLFIFFANSIILYQETCCPGRFRSFYVAVIFPACRISARFRAVIFRRAGFRHVSVQLFSGVPDFGTFPCSYFPACRISARFRTVIFRRAGFRHVSVQLFSGVPDFGTLMCSEPNCTLFLHNSCCHSCQR